MISCSNRSGSPTTDLDYLLRDFLELCARRSFRLGTHDCGLFLADWVRHVREGRDAAAPVRGAYASDAELKVLAGPLGLPRLFDRLLRAAGLKRTREPQFGDVAIVSAPGFAPRGAIVGRNGFVLVGEEGVSRAPMQGVRLIMAWSLAC